MIGQPRSPRRAPAPRGRNAEAGAESPVPARKGAYRVTATESLFILPRLYDASRVRLALSQGPDGAGEPAGAARRPWGESGHCRPVAQLSARARQLTP